MKLRITVLQLGQKLPHSLPPMAGTKGLRTFLDPSPWPDAHAARPGLTIVSLYRGGAESAKAAVGGIAPFSDDQIFELVRFVEAVSPDALH